MSKFGTLDGRAALVTGGSGGIGLGCARWLAADGAAVTLMGRTESTLVRAASELRRHVSDDDLVAYVVGDALEPNDMDAAVAAAQSLTGHLDIVVATVGGSTIVPLLLCTADRFRAEMDRNTLAPFLTIKHSTPALTAAGGGSIVCISSDAAVLPWQFMAGYCAGKAGLEALVRVAANELGHLKVRVNAVRPGLVEVGADRHAGLFDDPVVHQQFVDSKPLGRTGVPDDIGAAVRFLAGPESSWVTGQCVGVDGGAELRGAPRLEAIVRRRWPAEDVDAALAGRTLPRSE